MTTAQVTLTDVEAEAVRALSQSRGKTQEEILREAISQFVTQHVTKDRLAALRQARGLWRERQDLPDLAELRAEMGQVLMTLLTSSEPLMIDTDVIIDYLRERADAVSYLESLANPILISAITVTELYSGVREGEEREALDLFISAFEPVAVTQEIAVQGGLYRRDYSKSHNVGLGRCDHRRQCRSKRRDASHAQLQTLSDARICPRSLHQKMIRADEAAIAEIAA